MVYRYSWLAGFAAIAFSFWQLTKLLRPSVGTTHWQLIVLAGLLLGMIITWTAVSYRLSTWLVAGLNLGALFLAAARYAAPDSTILVVPTGESVSILRAELVRAWQVIQNGVEPVIPIPGLVVLVTAVFWGLGAVFVWGLLTRHPFVGLLPPLIVSLQFATVDRNPSGLAQVGVFVLLVAGAIMAVNADERDQGAGRMARPGRWPTRTAARPTPTAAALLGLTVLAAVFAVGLLNPLVPRDGVVTWRTSTGLTGGYFGSVAYNPFVEIRKGLVAQTETPVFLATVVGDRPPDQIYFRLLTLESYSGGQWYADAPRVSPTSERPWELAAQAYVGPIDQVTADVEILALTMDWLPAPYAPVDATAPDRSVESSLRVRTSDASLRYDGGLSYTGMRYTVTANIPTLDEDILSAGPEGGLSPLFATAAGLDEDVPEPPTDIEVRELTEAELETFTEIPEDLDPRIAEEAREVTKNLTTEFEQGLALEVWFRQSGGFVYDTGISPGHEADTISVWLFDEENPDRRRGYCEQFATSMALMARTLGIPSRVVLGFTPGERIGANQVIVRDKNAHAWVELWIPSQGWVMFDPTPRSDGANPTTTYGTLEEALGFDLTEYLAQVPAPETPSFETGGGIVPQFADDSAPEVVFLGGGAGEDQNSGLPAWLTVATGFVMLLGFMLAAIPIVKWFGRRRRMRRLEDGDITAAWEDIVARLTDFGEAPDPAATPAEVAATVDRAMTPLASVYGRSIYGEEMAGAREIHAATESLARTRASLTTRFSASQRLVAWYRVRSLVPRRWRDRQR